MGTNTGSFRVAPATKPEIDGLRALVASRGLAGASISTGLTREALTRALAGLRVSAGTRAAIREAIGPAKGAA